MFWIFIKCLTFTHFIVIYGYFINKYTFSASKYEVMFVQNGTINNGTKENQDIEKVESIKTFDEKNISYSIDNEVELFISSNTNYLIVYLSRVFTCVLTFFYYNCYSFVLFANKRVFLTLSFVNEKI